MIKYPHYYNNNQIHVELTLHGLYHWIDGEIEDFDSQSAEEEKKDIKQGLDILSSVNLS